MSQFFTVPQVAKQLALSKTTVRHLINCGKLKASRLGVRQWRVSEEELQRYITENTAK